jgi:hypothetical protein
MTGGNLEASYQFGCGIDMGTSNVSGCPGRGLG